MAPRSPEIARANLFVVAARALAPTRAAPSGRQWCGCSCSRLGRRRRRPGGHCPLIVRRAASVHASQSRAGGACGHHAHQQPRRRLHARDAAAGRDAHRLAPARAQLRPPRRVAAARAVLAGGTHAADPFEIARDCSRSLEIPRDHSIALDRSLEIARDHMRLHKSPPRSLPRSHEIT